MSCYSQHALLYHLLFLYLTCSCLFPYNLMITKAYKCRTNGGKSMPQAPVEKPVLPVTTRDNNLMFIWSVSVLLIQILALLQRERESCRLFEDATFIAPTNVSSRWFQWSVAYYELMQIVMKKAHLTLNGKRRTCTPSS